MLMAPEPAVRLGAPGARTSPVLLAILGLIALLAVAVPALIVANAPRVVVHKRTPVVISKRVVPKAELPPVEPVKLQEVAPEDARAINASIPFSTLPNPAARPFRLSGSIESQARAIDCLAAANYYEAGDDTKGQRAVAQVILNRMRHPAFPKSVCGVVFQGSERTTGCQFTFTCDGAMARYRPTPAAWERARDVARMALSGAVYAPVGHATHYHTDWVVPYWSASLEKITAVDTHLFFRWAGWWGTPPAFNRGYAGAEPNVPQMARLSGAHQGPVDDGLEAPMPLGDGSIVDPASIPDSAVLDAITSAGDENNFLYTLDRKMNPDAFAALAIRICGERAYCKFMAWADPKQTPARLPLSAANMAAMSFSYLRDQSQGFAKALWNCQQYRRPSPVQCMRNQPPVASAPAPAATPLPGGNEAKGAVPPATLTGVRRKSEVAPGARPPVSFTLPAPKATATPAAAPAGRD
jgi:spore germination cell wall hydrolase CwlJ-like protein